MKFEEIKQPIDEIFSEVVSLITDLMEFYNSNVTELLDDSISFKNDVKIFLENLLKGLGEIKEILFRKISDFNIDELQRDINNATNIFINITDSLELLSYNTICKTFGLGHKGATISYISKEIKKHSDSTKSILELIVNDFNNTFKNITELMALMSKIKEDSEYSESEILSIETAHVQTDVSVLVEHAQFHDIFMQQFDAINIVFENIDWDSNNLLEVGKQYKALTQAINLLEEMKVDASNALKTIKERLAFHNDILNNDLNSIQNEIVSINSSSDKANKIKLNVLNSINILNNKLSALQGNIDSVENYIGQLEKFSKSFNVLVVLTAIEVARLGDSDLNSLVTSMQDTYENLLSLIGKLDSFVSIWRTIYLDVVTILNDVYLIIEKYEKTNLNFNSKNVDKIGDGFEKSLNELKSKLMEQDYIHKMDIYIDNLSAEFDNMLLVLKDKLEFIEDNFVKNEEFNKGFYLIDIKKIKANEEQLSNVEFF